MNQIEVLLPLQASKARSILRNLRSTNQAIEGCALMTTDGRVASAVIGPETDPDRFGAMCASLIALASRAVTEADRGELRQLILVGTSGPVLLTRAGEYGVLAVSALHDCPLGRVIRDASTAALELSKITGIAA